MQTHVYWDGICPSIRCCQHIFCILVRGLGTDHSLGDVPLPQMPVNSLSGYPVIRIFQVYKSKEHVPLFLCVFFLHFVSPQRRHLRLLTSRKSSSERLKKLQRRPTSEVILFRFRHLLFSVAPVFNINYIILYIYIYIYIYIYHTQHYYAIRE